MLARLPRSCLIGARHRPSLVWTSACVLLACVLLASCLHSVRVLPAFCLRPASALHAPREIVLTYPFNKHPPDNIDLRNCATSRLSPRLTQTPGMWLTRGVRCVTVASHLPVLPVGSPRHHQPDDGHHGHVSGTQAVGPWAQWSSHIEAWACLRRFQSQFQFQPDPATYGCSSPAALGARTAA